jgi:UDP-3-O-[3-hydroxymyristoyl] glucosamine N-acyltransferase
VQLGGQAGLSGHLAVGDGAVVGAQAGVTKDVMPGTFVSGYPAMPHEKAKEMHAHLMRLPHLKKRVADLEQRLSDLEKSKSASK